MRRWKDARTGGIARTDFTSYCLTAISFGLFGYFHHTP
jgi:hypothetical protein